MGLFWGRSGGTAVAGASRRGTRGRTSLITPMAMAGRRCDARAAMPFRRLVRLCPSLALYEANADALRALRQPAARRLLRRAADGQLLASVQGGQVQLLGVRHEEALLQLLCAEHVEVAPRVGLLPAGSDRASVPLERLCWRYGTELARLAGLAPWLDDGCRYGLLRWPDLGAIGEDPVAFALCGLLQAGPLTPAQMQHRLGLPTAAVAAFLNAASLCEVLRPHPAS